MNMLKISCILIIFSLFIESCGSKKNAIVDNQTKTSEQLVINNALIEDSLVQIGNVVGNDLDQHGCKPSAGYTWSSLKKECIRIFELKLTLVNSDQSRIAGIIFSDDSSKVECFSKFGTFVLELQSDNYYTSKISSENYFLKKIDSKWSFGTIIDSKIEYTEK